MHQYFYKSMILVNQSQSETTLQCTNSSSEIDSTSENKKVHTSASDHNAHFGQTFQPNTWQYQLVEMIHDAKNVSENAKTEVKRFVTDFLVKSASPAINELSTGVPYTKGGHTKKRARPVTPAINELSTGVPYTKGGHTKKRARPVTPAINELSTDVPYTKGGHTKKRARPVTPAINELSTGVPYTKGGHTKKRARPVTPAINELSTGVPYTKGGHTKKRARPVTPAINELSTGVPYTKGGHTKKRARPVTPAINELSTGVPYTKGGHTKKRARPVTPAINEELNSGVPFTKDGHTKKRARPVTSVIDKELSRGVPNTSEGHTKKRARPITPAITVDKPLKSTKHDTMSSGISPIQMTDSLSSSFLPGAINQKRDQKHDESNSLLIERIRTTTKTDEATGPLIQTQSNPNTNHESLKDENSLYNESAFKKIQKATYDDDSCLLIRTQSKQNENEFPTYKISGDKEMVLRKNSTSSITNDTPPAVQSINLSCLNKSQEDVVADDDDDELDNEVAMFMANGVPPTSLGYRAMPQYCVPRLIEEEIKVLEKESVLQDHDMAYRRCDSTLNFTSEPTEGVLKIPGHACREFADLRNMRSIQIESSLPCL